MFLTQNIQALVWLAESSVELVHEDPEAVDEASDEDVDDEDGGHDDVSVQTHPRTP